MAGVFGTHASLCSTLLCFHMHFHTLYLAFHCIGVCVELHRWYRFCQSSFMNPALIVLVQRVNRTRRRSARLVRQGWLACLAALFLSNCVMAAMAAQYRLKDWTAENGLPQNVIRGIVQTPDGYL